VYELKGVGLDGKEKLFQKPWAMTTTMFVGETQLLPITHPGLHYMDVKANQPPKPSAPPPFRLSITVPCQQLATRLHAPAAGRVARL